MKNWEYKLKYEKVRTIHDLPPLTPVDRVDRRAKTIESDEHAQDLTMNELGRTGWELVSVQEENIDGYRWYKYWWKREKVYPPTETTSNE